jgi:hypothetical protein
MRLFQSLTAGAAVAGLSLTLAGGAVSAQSTSEAKASASLDKRLDSLEKTVKTKTGFFKVDQSAVRKVWRDVRVADKPDAPADPSSAYTVDLLEAGGPDPVILNAWITITTTFASGKRDPVGLILRGAAVVPGQDDGPFGSRPGVCRSTRQIPAGDSVVTLKYFCRGVVNVQAGEVYRLRLVLSGEDTQIRSLSASAKIAPVAMKIPASE